MRRTYLLIVLLIICTYPKEALAAQWIVESTSPLKIEASTIDTIEGTNLFLIETPLEAEQLLQIEGVQSVEKNEHVFLLPPVQPSLIRWPHVVNFPTYEIPSGLEKVKVAVLDSGVNLLDPTLAPYIEKGVSVFSHDTVHDTNGHGSEVTHIIVDQAPRNIRIVPIKILNHYGRGTVFSAMKGLHIAKEEEVNIVNLSFGGIKGSDHFAATVQELIDAGITVVAAAGNGGGIGAYYPAHYPGVFGIGSYDLDGHYASFSQTGAGVDLYFPGTHIATKNKDGETVFRNGTSFSTAYFVKRLAYLESLALSKPIDWKVHLSSYTNHVKKVDERAWYASILHLLPEDERYPPIRKSKFEPIVMTMSEPIQENMATWGSVFASSNRQWIDVNIEVNENQLIVTPETMWQADTLIYVAPTLSSTEARSLEEPLMLNVQMTDQ